MALYYGLFGLAANVALLTNLILIFGALSVLPATLTLPGVAGIVLTIGMAVDANVLIFERIREEARSGRSPLSAVDTGYREAMRTIIDANLTTLIAAVLLYAFGSGPVRGFAVTSESASSPRCSPRSPSPACWSPPGCGEPARPCSRSEVLP
jgi:preprotein translocase subunit SecD